MTTSDVPSTQRDVLAPTVTDLEARLVRERARSRLFDQAIAAIRVGRFTLHERLGAGGMGTVYAAYDAELERKVAIKFLAPDLDDHAILKQEARALARLTHPNVVAVHEVGEHEGRLFLAMEFVVGQTLRVALRDRARPGTAAPGVRDVVNLYLQAGRGLAAAHAAALVHGDFKPDNVLLGDDGRVRVLDFGLARAQGGAESTDADPDRIVGTPAYMAPEQFIVGGASPHSDQYSFCVALHEGLYGRRPFEAPDLAALKQAVVAGVLPDPPSGDVPAWVRAIVVRGLARDPSARWPDMDALLAALARDPAVVRRRVLLGVGAVALVASSVVASAALRGPPDALCTGAEARLEGVWDTHRKAAVKSALLSLGRSYGPASWVHVEHTLDEFAANLVTTHDEVCARTRTRGERSEALLDLSMACLDRRTDELAALVDVLATADDEVLARADTAVDALRDPITCEDTARLALPLPPPEDPEALRGVQATERELAQIGALRSAGRSREAHAEAAAIVDQARATGHRPTLAEALEMQAELLDDVGEPEVAIATGRAAIRAGEAGHHDELVARVRVWLVSIVVNSAGRPEEEPALVADAEAAIERLGGDAVISARLASYRTMAPHARGRWSEAHELGLVAVEKAELVEGPDSAATATALINLAGIELYMSRIHEALPRIERALAIWTALHGPDHPDVAYAYMSRANALAMLGRREEALADYTRALTIWEGAYGPNHRLVAGVLNSYADCLIADDRLAEAHAALVRGDAIWERTNPNHRHHGELLNTLGKLHDAQDDAEAALAAFSRAAAVFRAVEGDDGVSTAIAVGNMANILISFGRLDEAVPRLEAVIAAFEKGGGPNDPRLPIPLELLGDVADRRSDLRTASIYYERALRLVSPDEPDEKWVEELRAKLDRTRRR